MGAKVFIFHLAILLGSFISAESAPITNSITRSLKEIHSAPSQSATNKYAKPNAVASAENRREAMILAEQTRLRIVPTLHLVETTHFLIFSAWNRSNDAILADLCERMFQRLAFEFGVAPTEPIWVGKCPIYIFWEPTHYARFITEVDQAGASTAGMGHADGYHATRDEFSYIVINGVSRFGVTQHETKIRFFHVLVHEGTHAFLNRYLSDRTLPVWLEEGLADFVAATLVPQSEMNRSFLKYTASALRDMQSVRNMLEKHGTLNASEYGVAQSLVRFLVARDRGGIGKLLELMKDEATEAEALTTVYHLTQNDLLVAWSQYWQRALGRRR